MARGRQAETPLEIPAKGWKDIFLRLKTKISRDHIGLIAAGVAFYGLLAIFPAITAVMAVSGLVVEPAEVTRQLEAIKNFLPEEASKIILDQAAAVAGSEDAGLGLAFAVGLALAIYSASKGMASLIEGLNVAYDETEKRGFFKLKVVTLALTVVLVFGFLTGLISALVLPAVLKLIPLPEWIEVGLAAIRWVIMALLTITGLAVIYRFGPSRADAEWKWISPGAALACFLWLAASIGFSLYVANFGSYNETFGSLAGVVILLMWLWLSAYIVLFGAELNAELEAQTAKDSTTGPDKPQGERGAVKADVLGKSAAAAG